MLKGPDERSSIQKLAIYTIIWTQNTCPYYTLLDNGDQVMSPKLNTASRSRTSPEPPQKPKIFPLLLLNVLPSGPGLELP